MKSGQKIGSWELIEFLGKGGNGEVWKAFRPENNFVALKILKSRQPGSEPYKRFESEIEILQKLGARKGIVRLIDSFLPTKSVDPPPWLAMEIGTTIRKALEKDFSLENTIGAIAEIAETLSLLAQEGIYHRDIKPDNLFRVETGWAIGDFGLVSYPDKEALTEDGRKLGPMYYIAPEMLNNAPTAAGGPVDVYSLSKTLWVLITGQNFPLPGQHQSEIEQVALRSFLNHPRLSLLDILIERATQLDPLARPSMKQFADELQAWLMKPYIATPSQDISELVARIHPVLVRVKNKKVARDEQMVAFDRLVSDACVHMKPFDVICRRDLMGVEQTKDEIKSPIQTMAHEWLDHILPVQDEILRPIRHERPRIEAVCRPSGILSSNLRGQVDFVYYGMIDMRLYEEGEILLRPMHIVESRVYPSPNKVDNKYNVVWETSRTAPVLSAIAEATLNEVMEMWNTEFQRAIEMFINLIEGSNSTTAYR